MLVPEEFNRLTQWFYQGSHKDFSTLHEWIASAVANLNSEQRRTVKAFLDELLNGKHDASELQRVWNNSLADYYFGDDLELRGVFEIMQATLEQKS